MLVVVFLKVVVVNFLWIQNVAAICSLRIKRFSSEVALFPDLYI